MNSFIILTILTLLSTTDQVVSNRIFSREIDFGNNLSTNEVWKIKSDKTGFLWLCTSDGLARYDGHNTINFRNDYSHPNMLPGDSGTTDCIDGGTFIWIATRNGLRFLDKFSNDIITPKDTLLANSNIERLESSKEGIWVVHRTNLVSLCNLDGSLIKTYDLSESSSRSQVTINSILCDRQGTIWLSAGTAGLFYYFPSEDCFKNVQDAPELNFSALCQDRNNNYWVASFGQGLFYYQPNAAVDDQWTRFTIINPDSGEEDNSFFCVMQDRHEGYIWLLSFYNLYVLKHNDTKSIENVDVSGIINTHRMYTFISEDREGNLWISCFGKNAEILFEDHEILRFPLDQIPRRWGWNATIRDCKIDNQGLFWLNQDRLGLCLFDPESGTLDDVLMAWNLNLANSTSRNSAMWVNRYDTSIITLYEKTDGKTVPVMSVNLRNSMQGCGSVLQMMEDQTGILWVRAENAVFAITSTGSILTSGLKTIMDIDSGGNVYGVNEDGRIYRLFIRQNVVQEVAERGQFVLIDNETPRFVCADNVNGIWIYTSLGRFLRADLSDASVAEFRFDGIFDAYNIIGMTCFSDMLYIRTNHQLISYSISEGTYKIIYATDENIGMQHFLHNAFDVEKDGSVLIGGDGGLVLMENPNGIAQKWNFSPLITEISIDGNRIYTINTETPQKTLRLPSSAVNISISFSFLHYGLEPPPTVSFKMEGVDKDWVTVSSRGDNFAFYNKLPKGSHTFRLRYEYVSGKWIENSEPLIIYRRAHPLETIWAIILYALLFIGLLYFILSVFFKRKNLDQLLDELKTVHIRQSFAIGKIDVSKNIEESGDKFLNELSRIAQENLSNPEFSSAGMADALGMSKSTLVRRVKEYAGMTPFDYMRTIRMKKAKDLIDTSDMTVSELAYAVGFSSPPYFSQCFKEYYGCPPSEYIRTKKILKKESHIS